MDPIILLWIQAIATIFIGLTFGVYYFQLRVMKNASEAQNILTVISFLNSSENHQARKYVLSNMRDKKLEDWDQDDISAASKICASYDTAGLLMHDGIVKGDPILNNWGPSIKHCYEILSPFIKDMRKNMGDNYWDDFEWMYNKIDST